MALRYEYGDKTIQEFIHLHGNDQLNLQPGFRGREDIHVWSLPLSRPNVTRTS